jgi:ABC-2 type transport system permease protein
MSTLSRTTRLNRLPFVWKQMKVQFRMRTLSMFSFGLVVTQPVIFSAVGYFLARMAGRTQIDLIHTIIGSGVMGLWSTLLFTSFYDLRADRREGTLELLVGSPTLIFSILSIRTFANVLLGSLSFLLSLAVAFLLFGFSPPLSNLPYILISLAVLFFCFWCLGLFLAHWPVVSRLSGLFVNYLELPVGMLTGFMFPISLLPGWAQWLSGLTPMVWAFNGLSSAFQDGVVDPSSLWKNWLMALSIASVYLIMTFFMSKKVQDMIRVTGEMSSV